MRNPFSSVKKLPPLVDHKCKEKRGPWTAEEDELLSSYIKREGEGGWRTLPKKAGLLRCGKSCRLRWMNYLRPSLKRGHISPDEEDLILRLHRLLGNRWSLIAGRIPGRTDNEIKNYWNTHMSKKLISLGIDPRTHKPLSTTSSSINPNHKYLLSSSKPLAIISNPHENTSNSNTNSVLAPPLPVSIDMENDQMNQPNNEFNHEEDGDIVHNYDSPDDIFSSFLDSLINEEMCDEEQNLIFEPNHKDQEAKVDTSNDPNVDKKLY